MTIFISLITLWVLFADDFRVIFGTHASDPVFYIVTLFCFVIFLVEIGLSCFAKEEYFNSFFFYLDLVATITLLMDIGWISDQLFGSNSTSAVAARAGSKATRVIRIIRLIRLIRIVKFYKMAQQHRDKKREERRKEMQRQRDALEKIKKERLSALSLPPREASNSQQAVPQVLPSAALQFSESNTIHIVGGKGLAINMEVPNLNPSTGLKRESLKHISAFGVSQEFSDKGEDVDEDDTEATFKESNVNKTLTNNINKIVIVLILLIMLSVPLFSVDTYLIENYDAPTAGLYQLQRLMTSEKTDLFVKTFNRVFHFFEQTSTPVIYQSMSIVDDDGNAKVDMYLGNRDEVGKYRSSEVFLQASDTPIDNRTLNIYFKNRYSEVLGAWLGIGRTIFVSIILTVSILVLSRDTEALVLNPLEQMIKKISRISKNPLDAAEIEEKERAENQKIKERDPKRWAKIVESNSYEPAILEKIVIKIGSLLAIGFGEAGSSIIAQNMRLSGSVNPMIEGNKIVAIFGFCDIRQFSEVTDALKREIMPFVNRVADIVHTIVNRYQGAANKNIGEAFLLVWKIPKEETAIGEDGQLKTVGGQMTKILAELSIISFVKVVAEINKSYKLNEMCTRDEMIRYFNGNGYKLSMGFGLHIGWGIEGAIGSKFKIDASYLSPNVNMAARLEAATRQFKQHILISGVLVNYLGDNIKKYLRHIDTVTVKGSILPMPLYTVDLDVTGLNLHLEESPRPRIITSPVTANTAVNVGRSISINKAHQNSQPMNNDSKELRAVREAETLESQNRKLDERSQRRELMVDLRKNIKKTHHLIEADPDFRDMRKSFTKEFFRQWEIGFENYIEGRWEEARKIFEHTKVAIG